MLNSTSVLFALTKLVRRDVIRHITVVHKKVIPLSWENNSQFRDQSYKKPIDFVLNKVTKRGPSRDEAKT